jgi:hypothetical protein
MNAVSEADYLVQVADCEARRNKLIDAGGNIWRPTRRSMMKQQ